MEQGIQTLKRTMNTHCLWTPVVVFSVYFQQAGEGREGGWMDGTVSEADVDVLASPSP